MTQADDHRVPLNVVSVQLGKDALPSGGEGLPATFVSPDAAPDASAPTIIDTGSMSTMLPYARSSPGAFQAARRSAWARLRR